MRGSVLIEILVSLVILSLAIGIMMTTTSTAVKNYKLLKSKYLAMLTAENVLHALAAEAEVPSEMNGFKVDYHWEEKTLVVKVGRWIFKYEVNLK